MTTEDRNCRHFVILPYLLTSIMSIKDKWFYKMAEIVSSSCNNKNTIETVKLTF